MFGYNQFLEGEKRCTKVTMWEPSSRYWTNDTAQKTINEPDVKELREFKSMKTLQSRFFWLVLCLVLAFGIGLCFGVVASFYKTIDNYLGSPVKLEESLKIEGIFVNHSYSASKTRESDKVTFINKPSNKNRPTLLSSTKKEKENINSKLTASSSTSGLITDDIFWSDYVESLLPQGFTRRQSDEWNRYIRKGAVAIKLEKGCGRMQNRLVTFSDGRRACVRYRQNTDQIQGELFSFYLSQILNLRNLVPSAIGVVDVSLPIWAKLSNEIASAQWHSQRPVVLTQYIPNLDVGTIPKLIRPAESRHLNKAGIDESKDAGVKGVEAWELVELAQWSDLILFDYLTANLDRVVNNLYNHQWNSNIMEAPAHNLAKNIDNNLLVFLDNESGLLHGYRLLEKYEAYHGLLLDNLCVFRKNTAEKIATLQREGNVGILLNALFERRNPDRVKEVLPTIPEKSVKILNERIRRVHEQILKCQRMFKTDQEKGVSEWEASGM